MDDHHKVQGGLFLPAVAVRDMDPVAELGIGLAGPEHIVVGIAEQILFHITGQMIR